MDPLVEKAYSEFRTATEALHEALKVNSAVTSREYYRSDQRPIDEASREDAKKIAEQMQMCIKKRVPATESDLNKWSTILSRI